MIYSMTGYAVAAADIVGGTLNVELRSVNSRYLDIQFRIAEDLRMLESSLREAIGARLSRGKIDCRLSFSTAAAAPRAQVLDAEALQALSRLAGQVRHAIPDVQPLRAVDVLRWPGVLAEGGASDSELREQGARLAARAIDELIDSRSREGAKLKAVIEERVASMRERIAQVAPLVPQAIAAYQAKLAQRLREALGSADDERIRQEIAVFGMKIDIDEELQRLKTHLDEVGRVLKTGLVKNARGAAGTAANPVGKRLDFLMQELNREANTLGSKAASKAISECALELKLLIEQMREQVQNIE
ncbi:MAG: YicC family protein [Betaproteobacteria bacterium]|nr:YicC family protein [Betaproteobacteria bacterium]